MGSTSDLWYQAMMEAKRPGTTPGSVTALADFDPTAYLRTYGAAAAGDFKKTLNRSVGDLKGADVGAGRLNTGFYTQDTGRLVTDISDQYERDLASKSMEAAGLKASTLGTAAGFQEGEQQNYYDMLSGQLDRETAAQNARRQQQSGLLGGLGSLAGTIGSAAILASSKRFKDNVEPIASATERLERMPGVNFTYKGSDEPQTGVLAEDADQAAPEAVLHNGQGEPTMVDYIKLLPVTIQAVRELAEQVRQLKGGGMGMDREPMMAGAAA